MSDVQKTKLGDAIFGSIDDNDFLNVLYDNMLYNYAILKLHLEGFQQARQVDVEAALRFADLLSKSTHPTKSDDHKMWAQAIITLLLELEPDNEDVAYYAGSVLSSIGNFRGTEIARTTYKSGYTETTLQEKAYATFISDYLSIPAERDKRFFIPQKNIYDQLNNGAFSYSAPTSMGKSFIMEVFIKDKIQKGEKFNFARIVPTKALINEVREDTVMGLDKLLEEMNYSVVTAASDYSLEEDHNFILVMTPERLLYLLISKPEFKIDYIFIDEAHKMTGRNSRGPFYYKTVDMLAQQKPMPHFIFASPNIPNPEVYLKLVTEAQKGEENAISSTFAPVTQFKFLISQETKSIRIFNDHTQDTIFVCKYGNATMSVVDFMNIMTAFDRNKPLNERKRLGALLDDRPQTEVMAMIPQFSQAETDNFVAPPAKIPEALGVLMFNMERGVNLPEIQEFLRDCPDIQPFDVILANELDDGCARSGNKNTARELAQAFGLNYAWGLEFIELVNDENAKGFHGNAVFSRWPIRRAGVIRLPEQYNWYFDRQKRIGGRLAVFAELDVGGQPVGAVSIHLENRTHGEGRKAQMAAILEAVRKELPDMPLILGGDLNTNTFDGRAKEDIGAIAADPALRRRCLEDVGSFEPLLPLCAADGYEIVPKEPRLTRRKPLPNGDSLPLRLDWILLKGVTASESRMISTAKEDLTYAKPGSALERFQGAELSDHNAVWAMCRLR